MTAQSSPLFSSSESISDLHEALNNLISHQGLRQPNYVMLLEALAELRELRSAQREFICVGCKVSYPIGCITEVVDFEVCPNCNSLLDSYVVGMRKIYIAEIESLNKKIENLEFCLRQVLDLDVLPAVNNDL